MNHVRLDEYRLPVIEAPATAAATAEKPGERPCGRGVEEEIADAGCNDDALADAAHLRQRYIDQSLQVFDVVTVVAEIDANPVRHVGDDAVDRFVRHIAECLDAVRWMSWYMESLPFGDSQLVMHDRAVTGWYGARRSEAERCAAVCG
jgi:hypothetical protein